MDDKVFCDKCNKCLTVNEVTYIGAVIKLDDSYPLSTKYKKGKNYNFCWDCLLDRMFGKD